MTSFQDLEKVMLRNLLLGRWAARKLGLSDAEAAAYAQDLAAGSRDPEKGDVFARIRRDFDAAGLEVNDEAILAAMAELSLKAGAQMPTRNGDTQDGASLALARSLKPS